MIQWVHEGKGRRVAESAQGQRLVILPRVGRYGKGVVAYELYKHVGPGENDWDLDASADRLKHLLRHAEEAFG